jgi:hypothetical protein
MALALLTSVSLAVGPGQSFTWLSPGFTQELVGTSADFPFLYDDDGDGRPDNILGGVAFAADGDPLVTDCEFAGTRMHRFDLAGTPTTVHGSDLSPETIIATEGGCGIVNHPDGSLYVAMHDGVNGVANVDRETGALIGFMGPPANALGIAVDPVTQHLIYAAADCRFTGTCTLIEIDTTDGSHTTFATLGGIDAEFVDGMYFDPSGQYLFLSNRWPVFRLTVLARDGSLVQHVPMTSEPDGVAFHAGDGFVVTNNVDGTMTRFDFPAGDYTQAPTQALFASGGFRGDLLQVGPDGCIYLTQKGTRYDDGTERPSADPFDPEFSSAENSVVRICGGFAPPPGVGGDPGNPEQEPCPAPAGTPPTQPGEVSRNINSYVLFAYEELSFKGNGTGTNERGVIAGGHVGVNTVDFTPNNSSVLLSMGGGGGSHEVFMSDGSQVVADSARLDADSKIYDLFVNILMGGSPPDVRHSGPTPFAHATATEAVIAAAALPALPPFAAGSTSVTVVSGATVTLAPGTYGDVTVQNNGTLNLGDGVYTVQNLRGGKHVRINTAPQTVVRIAGEFATNNDSYVGPAGTAQFLVRSDGVKSNDHSIGFGRNTEAHGQFFAPNGIMGLGHTTDLYGRFIAKKIGSDFSVNVTLVCPAP